MSDDFPAIGNSDIADCVKLLFRPRLPVGAAGDPTAFSGARTCRVGCRESVDLHEFGQRGAQRLVGHRIVIEVAGQVGVVGAQFQQAVPG